MTLFLSAVSVDEAIRTVLEITRPLEAESVPLKESFGGHLPQIDIRKSIFPHPIAHTSTKMR
jgi:molybdopterin biosynthesis enzyme